MDFADHRGINNGQRPAGSQAIRRCKGHSGRRRRIEQGIRHGEFRAVHQGHTPEKTMIDLDLRAGPLDDQRRLSGEQGLAFTREGKSRHQRAVAQPQDTRSDATGCRHPHASSGNEQPVQREFRTGRQTDRQAAA